MAAISSSILAPNNMDAMNHLKTSSETMLPRFMPKDDGYAPPSSLNNLLHIFSDEISLIFTTSLDVLQIIIVIHEIARILLLFND